jgi:hypothetical protein
MGEEEMSTNFVWRGWLFGERCSGSGIPTAFYFWFECYYSYNAMLWWWSQPRLRREQEKTSGRRLVLRYFLAGTLTAHPR